MSWSVGAGFEGRGVIVTGAAGGIGRAVAEEFATAGARVLATDLRQNAVDAIVAGLAGSGHLAASANLTDLDAHAALIARRCQVSKRHGSRGRTGVAKCAAG